MLFFTNHHGHYNVDDRQYSKIVEIKIDQIEIMESSLPIEELIKKKKTEQSSPEGFILLGSVRYYGGSEIKIEQYYAHQDHCTFTPWNEAKV